MNWRCVIVAVKTAEYKVLPSRNRSVVLPSSAGDLLPTEKNAVAVSGVQTCHEVQQRAPARAGFAGSANVSLGSSKRHISQNGQQTFRAAAVAATLTALGVLLDRLRRATVKASTQVVIVRSAASCASLNRPTARVPVETKGEVRLANIRFEFLHAECRYRPLGLLGVRGAVSGQPVPVPAQSCH